MSFSRFTVTPSGVKRVAGAVDHGAIARQRGSRRHVAGPSQAWHIEPLDELLVRFRIEIVDVKNRATSVFDGQRKQSRQRRITSCNEHRIR